MDVNTRCQFCGSEIGSGFWCERCRPDASERELAIARAVARHIMEKMDHFVILREDLNKIIAGIIAGIDVRTGTPVSPIAPFRYVVCGHCGHPVNIEVIIRSAQNVARAEERMMVEDKETHPQERDEK